MKVSSSFSVIDDRRFGNFSTTSLLIKYKSLNSLNFIRLNDNIAHRTNAITSTAAGLLESPKNSMSTWTTFAATSENLIAQP
jgi:hypothetical protein